MNRSYWRTPFPILSVVIPLLIGAWVGNRIGHKDGVKDGRQEAWAEAYKYMDEHSAAEAEQRRQRPKAMLLTGVKTRLVMVTVIENGVARISWPDEDGNGKSWYHGGATVDMILPLPSGLSEGP